jgi:hypothetical protein
MKSCRALLVLLLCLVLPYSASAGLGQDLQCHHDGLGVLLDAPQHHHHSAADAGCDCPVKCTCQHHCAAGGEVPLALGAPDIRWPARMEAVVESPAAPLAAAHRASLLRPPTTPSGAA